MLDDEFVVNTWQDKEIPFTIHFVVAKQGKVSPFCWEIFILQ